MKKSLFYGLLLLQLFVIQDLFGQEKNIRKTNQQWVQYYNTTQLNQKYTLLIDGGFRWKDALSQNSQYILRAALKRSIGTSSGIAAGLAYSGFYNNGLVNKTEIRPYQELNLISSFGKLALSHRYRVEERFFETIVTNDIPSINSFNFRFRYAINASIPLLKVSQKEPDRKVTLNIGDEVFLNAGGQIENRFFDQNRLLLGTSVPAGKDLTFTLTYNSQFGSTSLPYEYNHSNIIWLGVKHNLDLNKKS
ncbi:DUF2490 domain-containing protein [Arcticibacterium luteifluviistationis]|uniref:DUF2490 domain-containing protein n=1 Tax=Arcticibacterium luteifluviistationis TaxID=1784714 RepID=A0A2Z4G7Z6_9BACT|nr:DUF2490 domain-containing protein [Arcticibacterium luteifluviistationis]AWV97208.1 hypothetical protein DJ013_03090 [Arcticibacterium luteifluviistationis]